MMVSTINGIHVKIQWGENWIVPDFVQNGHIELLAM